MPNITTYERAAEYLGRKTDRPLPGRATRLIRRDDSTIAVRYQATDVVTYRAGDGIVLQSGGWQTYTTKERFKEYSRAMVFADRGTWYMAGSTDTGARAWGVPKHQRPLYYDGVIVDPATGAPINPRYPTQSDVAKKRALDRDVRNYIAGYAAHINAGELTPPGNGDCWGCLMQVQGAPPVTQGAMRLNRPTPHGRVEPMGVDHYFSHLAESYFVPSLLWNAINARGYRDPRFIWEMIAQRKDGQHAAQILRGYFKNLKPALLAEFQS